MTPRERAEACIGAAERVSYVVGGMTPDRSVEYSHARDFLADSAPALARDLIAAMDREAKAEAAIKAARACVAPLTQFHAAKVGDCPGCVARRVLEQALRIYDTAALDAAKGGE